jgi:hypothetical protein
MSETDQSWLDEGRARKRMRLSSGLGDFESTSTVESLFWRINRMLTGQETSEIEGLSEIAP